MPKTTVDEKKVALKAKTPAATKKRAVEPSEAKYTMPMEVKDWIDRANSLIAHQKGEIDRLKKENNAMKDWRRWAENRILRSDHE